jgi:hypothetical protein
MCVQAAVESGGEKVREHPHGCVRCSVFGEKLMCVTLCHQTVDSTLGQMAPKSCLQDSAESLSHKREEKNAV